MEIKLKKGKFYAYFTAKEEYPAIEITKDYGVIGIDLNAYPSHIAWAETDEFGNLLAYGEVPTPELYTGNSNKSDYYAWIYAHKITEIAKEKGKAIVIEELKIKNKGRRGDYSGRRSRRIRHNFAYRKLLERIEILAKRKGIEVIEVDSAYTSVIGMLKYAPQCMVSKDVGSAYVIARRGLGLEERIPKTYRDLPEKLDVRALEEFRDYIREREKHLKEIEDLMESFGSLESEQVWVSKPLGGTSLGIRGSALRVLRVVVLTALSPGRVLRDLSTLKRVLLQGKWGDLLRAQFLLQGQGLSLWIGIGYFWNNLCKSTIKLNSFLLEKK